MTKERKYLYLCGAVLLLAGLVYRFYPSDVGLTGFREGFALKQRKIIKYSSVVGQKESVEKHLKKLNKIVASSVKQFLKGSTPALAAVEIQNILNQIADKVEISISRIDIKKETREKGETIISIPVRFNIVSTTTQLKDMIYYIESSDKLLRIVDMKSNVLKKKHPEQIRSTITIEGFIRE